MSYHRSVKRWFFLLIGVAVPFQWVIMKQALDTVKPLVLDSIHAANAAPSRTANGQRDNLESLKQQMMPSRGFARVPQAPVSVSRTELKSSAETDVPQPERSINKSRQSPRKPTIATPPTGTTDRGSGLTKANEIKGILAPSIHQELERATNAANSGVIPTTMTNFPPAPQIVPSSSTTKFSSFHWQDPNRFRFYKPDLICVGCYQHAFPSEVQVRGNNGTVATAMRNITCGELIWNETQRIISTSIRLNATIQAASEIASKYPDHCQQCDPASCSAEHKIYIRVDDAAPTILQSWTRPISKLLPKSNVFPKEGVQNPKAFFANPSNRYSKTKKYFWEYNPSLVVLKGHEHLIPPGIIQSNKQQSAFLSTHRESIIPTTFLHYGKIRQKDLGDLPNNWQRFERINFSFLSHDMTVLQEGIFNVGYADYRLFILNEQLYLGMWNRIYPIWIMPAKKNNNRTANNDTKETFTHGHRVKILRDLYRPNTCPFELHIAEQHLCCANGCTGKNYNYFTTRDGTMWVQTRPAGPLEVQKVVPCDARYWEEWWTQAPTTNETTIYTDTSVPAMSFGTADETYLATLGVFANHKLSSHRGTACCIRMQYHEHQDLLIGISHRRDRGNPEWKSRNTQYTSNFYATLAEPPFSLVRMSGSFCLGHPNQEDEAVNHLVPLTRLHNYTFGGIHYYKCPMISFLHSMVENPSNNDTVIIGYGVNDLINRFVEVSKANILQMLFEPYG